MASILTTWLCYPDAVLDTMTFIIAFVAVLFAGIIQSITGFGFGIVAMPLLTIFISPKLAAPITVCNSILLNLIILSRAHVHVDLPRIWPLVVAGMTGVPLGIWMLVNWDVNALRVYVGVATIAFTLIFLTGFRREVQREKLAFVPIGLASGVMSGSINMAGPPVILFLTNQALPRAVFRATIVAYFLIVTVWAVPMLIAVDLLDVAAFKTAVMLAPGLAIGAFIGTKLAPHVDDVAVRRITLGIVLAAGVTSLLAGFKVL